MKEKAYALFIYFFIVVTMFTVIIALLMVYGQFNTQNDITTGVILEESVDIDNEYLDKIIFLGESTTYGLKHYGVLSGGVNTTQVWTGGKIENGIAKTTGTLSLSPNIANAKIFYPDTNEIMDIKSAIKLKSPEYLIITLGLNNGVSYYNEQEFKDCYSLLIESINSCPSPPKIILQSIFPVSRKCAIQAFTPEKITKCNTWILELAEAYNVKYLNTFEILCDADGYLFESYENGDGIHLNKEGLVAVVNYIKHHGYCGE